MVGAGLLATGVGALDAVELGLVEAEVVLSGTGGAGGTGSTGWRVGGSHCDVSQSELMLIKIAAMVVVVAVVVGVGRRGRIGDGRKRKTKVELESGEGDAGRKQLGQELFLGELSACVSGIG